MGLANINGMSFGAGLRVRPFFAFGENPTMAFVPKVTMMLSPKDPKQGCHAPTGTRLRSALALRKAERTAQGRL